LADVVISRSNATEEITYLRDCFTPFPLTPALSRGGEREINEWTIAGFAMTSNFLHLPSHPFQHIQIQCKKQIRYILG